MEVEGVLFGVAAVPDPTATARQVRRGLRSWLPAFIQFFASQNCNREELVEFTKSERISLKSHEDLDEKWVQQLIATDPSILGLGELVLRDKERIQPRAGRLDLLLQDPETKRRYEVEVELGLTDETHIIRTIEY